MKSSPAFQFYPKEFLSSSKVMAMSLAERGAYITLLSVEWLDGSLPNDVNSLARLLAIPERKFQAIWQQHLAACFVERDGRLINERLERVRAEQEAYREQQKLNGARGGRPRKGSVSFGLTQTKATDKPTETQNLTETKAEKTSSSASASAVPLPKNGSGRTHAGGHGLLKPHGNVAFDSPRVWVPWPLHIQLQGLRNNPNANEELQAFYADVSEDWNSGAHAAANVDPEMFNFWRARYAERWPPEKPERPRERGADELLIEANKAKYAPPKVGVR